MEKEEFYKKIREEYEEFKKHTFNKPKDEIYNSAFEIVIKDYIKEFLSEYEFTDEQLEKLNDIDDLIEYIFQYFLENGEYLDFDDLCEEGINDVLQSLGVLESEIE